MKRPKPRKGTPPPAAKRAAKRIISDSVFMSDQGRKALAKRKPATCATPGCVNPAGEDGLCDACQAEWEEIDREESRVKAEEKDLAQTQRRHGGFNQYAIAWTSDHTHFKFETDRDVYFYGWYRRTRIGTGDNIAHALDVFAKVKTGEQREFSVKSLTYADDPRTDLNSLNADLCAVANMWFYKTINADVESIEDLIQQAKRPKFIIKTFGTLDKFISELREIRKVAVVSGGTRILTLQSDVSNGDVVGHIELNLTAQAMALEGKIPSLQTGVMYDRVREDRNADLSSIKPEKGKKVRIRNEDKDDKPKKKLDYAPTKVGDASKPQRLSITPAAGNVQALHDQLSAAKAADDVPAQRKIRAALRSIGVRGGLRGLEAKKGSK